MGLDACNPHRALTLAEYRALDLDRPLTDNAIGGGPSANERRSRDAAASATLHHVGPLPNHRTQRTRTTGGRPSTRRRQEEAQDRRIRPNFAAGDAQTVRRYIDHPPNRRGAHSAMTTPTDIRRLLNRIRNSADIAEARLEHAAASIARRTADGYPSKASGAETGPRATADLTPTEAAANANLGHLAGYVDPDDGKVRTVYGDEYKPGPSTQLADIADELRAALKNLDRAHTAITDCGVPPLVTQQFRCTGINGQGCDEWKDPNRTDGLGINCGRTVDSNRRRQRRHRNAS